MDESHRNMEAPKKIIEPLINIPKPRPQIYHPMQHQKNSSLQHVKHTPGMPKYGELVHVIEELGQHVRPSYAGHRGSAEKIKQGITRARILVKECIAETERNDCK